MDNKNLGLKCYADMKHSLLSHLWRQANIDTENQLMDFCDSSWEDCSDTDRSTGSYIIFYHGGTIDYGTHVPGTASQSSAESEYNASFTAGMALTHIRMLIN